MTDEERLIESVATALYDKANDETRRWAKMAMELLNKRGVTLTIDPKLEPEPVHNVQLTQTQIDMVMYAIMNVTWIQTDEGPDKWRDLYDYLCEFANKKEVKKDERIILEYISKSLATIEGKMWDGIGTEQRDMYRGKAQIQIADLERSGLEIVWKGNTK